MDWFEKITGFRESGYLETKARLACMDGRLLSCVNDAAYGIGTLELVSLQELRVRAAAGGGVPGRMTVTAVSGDVRRLHAAMGNGGAMFQVASQFNLLEMMTPEVTPEDGVTRYEADATQGPACAIAAGAATIYRNYFAPVGKDEGQTAARQIDALADLGAALSLATGMPVAALWRMRNGYALATRAGLAAIEEHVGALGADGVDRLRGLLQVGAHWDVEVTDAAGPDRPHVSQVFCSALPVAYSAIPAEYWRVFACLVLEAAYEATVWGAVLNAQRGASRVLFLTLLGGGAFGNPSRWIYAAIRRALEMVRPYGIEVRLVSRGVPSRETEELVRSFG